MVHGRVDLPAGDRYVGEVVMRLDKVGPISEGQAILRDRGIRLSARGERLSQVVVGLVVS